MGTRQKELCHTIPFSNVMKFVHWELFENHLFVVSNHVLSRERGVHREGCVRAAILTILYDTGTRTLQCLTTHVAPQDAAPLATLHVTMSPIQVSGQFGGHWPKPNAIDVQKIFQKIYGLKLQEEGEGQQLQTLEAVLQLHQTNRALEMGLKDKISFQEHPDPRRRFVRYPNAHSPNTKTVLQSLIPALAMKCILYATGWDGIAWM